MTALADEQTKGTFFRLSASGDNPTLVREIKLAALLRLRAPQCGRDGKACHLQRYDKVLAYWPERARQPVR